MTSNNDRRTLLKLPGLLGLSFALNPIEVLFGSDTKKEPEATAQNESPIGLDAAYDFSNEDLKRYLSWIDKTIEESSKNKNYALIIDKSQYTLSIINNGKLHSQYNIELGPNPVDDKRIEGDGCTPEGMYDVVKKKDKGQTQYYRALLINYPNVQDKHEFDELKKTSKILPSDTIGSLIEIHGMGTGHKGKAEGQNWTLGCVAVSNADMDNIFSIANDGARVTIVKYGTAYPNHLSWMPNIESSKTDK